MLSVPFTIPTGAQLHAEANRRNTTPDIEQRRFYVKRLCAALPHVTWDQQKPGEHFASIGSVGLMLLVDASSTGELPARQPNDFDIQMPASSWFSPNFRWDKVTRQLTELAFDAPPPSAMFRHVQLGPPHGRGELMFLDPHGFPDFLEFEVLVKDVFAGNGAPLATVNVGHLDWLTARNLDRRHLKDGYRDPRYVKSAYDMAVGFSAGANPERVGRIVKAFAPGIQETFDANLLVSVLRASGLEHAAEILYTGVGDAGLLYNGPMIDRTAGFDFDLGTKDVAELHRTASAASPEQLATGRPLR